MTRWFDSVQVEHEIKAGFGEPVKRNLKLGQLVCPFCRQKGFPMPPGNAHSIRKNKLQTILGYLRLFYKDYIKPNCLIDGIQRSVEFGNIARQDLFFWIDISQLLRKCERL